ncbi:MAG: SRPBCC family protein [Rhodanobacteraceae bacterium]|nr:SRPBCC family protein [Rhodanobacteraceae bacterium]
MLKTIALILVAIIACVLIAAALQPDSFRVERSIRIKAPPEKIFAFIDDFHRWAAWSPWEKLDSAMKRDYSGAASGQGAVYAWEGNSKVGQGRMQIVESSPHSVIRIQLDFLKPFEAHNTAEFRLQAEADGTEVRWAMHGPQPYLSKLMGLVFNMDKLIGKDFETGLANLKSVAET